jgi:murein DD-endopeptidase MepM/ murein hydrolase activator NlpD
LPASQARTVTQILDQMAAKVIYSREHLLQSSYLVRAGDTLDAIADRYHVPALLLARINGIRDPQNLPAGKELKVLTGPFSAQISTDRSEMTLMLDGRYAGRFTVLLSSDMSHVWGMCTVRNKTVQDFVAGMDMGKRWIGLSNASGNIVLYMQGTSNTRHTTVSEDHGKIWLSEQDMDDVFGILSVGSSVIIQR